MQESNKAFYHTLESLFDLSVHEYCGGSNLRLSHHQTALDIWYK